MESIKEKDIRVIGDACIGGELASNNAFPNFAQLAMSQAKVVARFNALPAPQAIYTKWNPDLRRGSCF